MLCEFTVNESFERFINECDSYRAALACRAAALSSAIDWVRACGKDCLSSLCSDLKFRCLVPDQEDRVGSDEVGSPLVGLFGYVHVDAVLEVLLHVSINKQVEACKIREGNKLRQRCALLVTKLLEQLEMQVTNLLLCDRRLRVNRIKPSVYNSSAFFSLCCETFLRKCILIFDVFQCQYKSSSLGQSRLVFTAEVFYIIVEVFCICSLDSCVSR